MAEEGGKPSAQGASAGSQEGRPRGEPPSLSLPKGGGALRGMGEKFATHPSNGTASLSIPIATSPGRSGFGPQLSLDYDSGAPNGPFGIGWHLAVPAITRKTDKGLPRYLDAEESDVFILSGAEDLVPLRDGGGAVVVTPRDGYAVVRYRPRVEGLFARIERWTRVSDGDTHWRATTRENLTSIYGRDPAARIADPEAPWRVFSWLLEESRDDRGNVMRYGYQGEDGAGVDPAAASEANRFERHSDGTRRFLATAQRYLKTIWYGNRVPVAAGDPAPGGDGDWLFQVVLDYGEHDPARPTPTAAAPWPVRSDPFSSGRSAFEVRTYRLCRRVLMFHRFEELGAAPCLVRSTDLAYPAASGDPGWDERRSLTFLSSVTHASYRADGAGGYVRAALPPLALGYALPELHDELRELAASDLEGIPAGVEGAGVQWIDLDGEGIPGALIAQPNAWYYKPSLGDGRLAPPTALGRLPSPADLHGGLQTLSDVDGDGRLELVSYAQPLAGWFSRTAAGWTPFGTFPSLPALDWRDPNLRMLDLDGDGHADVLITENDLFVWYRSRAKDGFEPAAVVTHSRDEELGPAVLFADGTETLFLADMTGDGLVDLVRVRNGEVCYWANLGYGRFGRKVTLEGSPQFDRIDQFDPRRIRLADVDGSGTADVLYLGRDGVDLYFNQAGNALADRRTLRALPAADSLAGTSVVDLLGTGTACLVWSSPAPARDRRPIAYVDLMGGRKPNLLTSIDNNLGAETKIHYAPSTRFYLADKAAGQPWITRLPFPVQVVERVDTYDRVSRNRFVTSHAYHHGFYDGVEREFRGFGRIDNWDTEAWAALTADGTLPDGDNFIAESHVPPVLTRSWFHTGAFAGARRISRLYAHEYFREP
ncbi:MAG TPA: SpvB/TcaC N-terminal domain-containing protein, partial [Polyangia bacterium]|nr:SpvB/TcaC N-terminal domain-containing protein [Polyangia bacterium]